MVQGQSYCLGGLPTCRGCWWFSGLAVWWGHLGGGKNPNGRVQRWHQARVRQLDDEEGRASGPMRARTSMT